MKLLHIAILSLGYSRNGYTGKWQSHYECSEDYERRVAKPTSKELWYVLQKAVAGSQTAIAKVRTRDVRVELKLRK